MKKQIMTRAWQIAREGAAKFGGNAREYMAAALRMAWEEIKMAQTQTQQFDKTAKMVVLGREHYEDASKYLTFNAWEKYGKRRIYINDYKRRTIGYIDRETGEYTQHGNNGLTAEQISSAINAFRTAYAF